MTTRALLLAPLLWHTAPSHAAARGDPQSHAAPASDRVAIVVRESHQIDDRPAPRGIRIADSLHASASAILARAGIRTVRDGTHDAEIVYDVRGTARRRAFRATWQREALSLYAEAGLQGEISYRRGDSTLAKVTLESHWRALTMLGHSVRPEARDSLLQAVRQRYSQPIGAFTHAIEASESDVALLRLIGTVYGGEILVPLLRYARPWVERVEDALFMLPESLAAVAKVLEDDASSGPNARRHAINVLSRYARAGYDLRPALPNLVALLRDGDWRIRFNAAEALGHSRLGAASEPLRAALIDEDERVRRHAAEGLGRLGDPAAVPSLVAVLREGDATAVERAAADALVALGSAAVEPLTALLREPGARSRPPHAMESRWWAANALGRIGDRRAVKPLIDMLRERISLNVRREVGEALRALTGQDMASDYQPWIQWWTRERGNPPARPGSRYRGAGGSGEAISRP